MALAYHFIKISNNPMDAHQIVGENAERHFASGFGSIFVGNRVRARLIVPKPSRVSGAPEIATADKAGLLGSTFQYGVALFAPMDNPTDSIAKLNELAVDAHGFT